MISTRLSGAGEHNDRVRATADVAGNLAWIAGHDRDLTGAVVLVGGTNIVDFRLRVAQGHVRHDLLPSFWSQVGIATSAKAFLTVAVDDGLRATQVPSTNAIVERAFAEYDDATAYPNIAIIHFATLASEIVTHARRLQRQRSAIDLPRLVVDWLAFLWGAGTAGNPLLQNLGVPSAAFVETAFGIAGIELTPGVASTASCPEAIWQSAIWWHEYYEKTVDAFPLAPDRRATEGDRLPAAMVPEGAFLVRQPSAAVVETPRSQR